MTEEKIESEKKWRELEARRDWELFRELWKEYAEPTLRDFPDTAMEEPVCRRYESFDRFMQDYPTPEARSKILKQSETLQERLRDTAAFADRQTTWDEERAKKKDERGR